MIILHIINRPLKHVKASIIAGGMCLGLLTAALLPASAAAADTGEPLSGQKIVTVSVFKTRSVIEKRARLANFKRQRASKEARSMADWVVTSGDNSGMPFVIVDKISAKVFVFDATGGLLGATPALLGLAWGDVSVPGIGEREMAVMKPEERITPAGRFVAALGHNSSGKEILWVDYDAAISLHRVITTRPQEHRLERLATTTPLDNRITYGCINVPTAFYEDVVSPAFAEINGIVYVLPETGLKR